MTSTPTRPDGNIGFPPDLAVRDIFDAIGEVLSRVLQQPEAEDRTGGYFKVFGNRAYSDPPLLEVLFGHASAINAPRYSYFANEKAIRLLESPDHVSSWQSRDRDAKLYGGAIRGQRFVFSFSGFTEHLDEAATVLVALVLEDIDLAEAARIFDVSNNIVGRRLVNEMFNPANA